MGMKVDRGYVPSCDHLGTRCQQRGVRRSDLELLLDMADQQTPVGSGRVALTLSGDVVLGLRAEGIPSAALEKLARRAVVIDPDGRPITVLIPQGRRGRHYRRSSQGRRYHR